MSKILTLDKINEHVHDLNDQWLGARVVGWMNSEGAEHFQKTAWWIMAIYANGLVRTVQSDPSWEPPLLAKDLARKLCRYINKECAHGGAWLVGYFGEMLYFLWKDKDGDIQVPLEFLKPLHVLLGWTNEDFAEHCDQALTRWVEWHESMEYGRGQQKRLAQGERLH